MFNQQSRDDLYENAYYEVYLIREILEVQELALGKVLDQHYTIYDEGPTEISSALADSLGAGHATKFSKKLTPLIMASAFKILDQIWEWILSQNSKVPNGHFWSFRAKYNCFTNENLTYPDFIDSQSDFQDVLKGLYTHFWPRRNAIIHSGWGTLEGSDLHFDFHYNDVTKANNPSTHIDEILQFKDILTFADFSHQLLEMVHNPGLQTDQRLSVLKVLSDRLSSFHSCTPFGEKQVLMFNVHRKTKKAEISIKDIREKLEPSALGHPFYFQLTITDENNNETWEVFSGDLPNGDILKLHQLKTS